MSKRKDDLDDFIGYLKNLTDAQVQGVYEKEKRARRHEYAALALIELGHRLNKQGR